MIEISVRLFCYVDNPVQGACDSGINPWQFTQAGGLGGPGGPKAHHSRLEQRDVLGRSCGCNFYQRQARWNDKDLPKSTVRRPPVFQPQVGEQSKVHQSHSCKHQPQGHQRIACWYGF